MAKKSASKKQAKKTASHAPKKTSVAIPNKVANFQVTLPPDTRVSNSELRAALERVASEHILPKKRRGADESATNRPNKVKLTVVKPPR